MSKLNRLLCIATLSLAVGQPVVGQEKVNPDAKLLKDFETRIDAYMKLHNELERDAPKLKDKAEPEEIKAHEEALAEKIRAARKTAKPGEIFTPDVRALFRRLMYPELKGKEGAETKAEIKEDAPAAVPLRVNARYPQNQPLPTVPPNVLARLPKLPEELEYRIVKRDLILRDVHANLIVDYIPNAIR
jgi:hypothetical protein